jgi:hypothetical protein
MVRQLLICYFSEAQKFPFSRMSVERTITMLGLTRRYDLVLFDRSARPILLAECKAPAIDVNQNVVDQAARYNITLRVPYLLVTNGRRSHCCLIDFANESWQELSVMPDLGV